MDILKIVQDELTGFFGLHGLIDIYKTGNYSVFHTWEGIKNLIYPLIPFLLIIEIIRAALYKKFHVIDYKVQFITYFFNSVVGRFISIAAVGSCIKLFGKYALFQSDFTWYWLIYGYIAWELSHFVYHYLAHKVRLLWCLHATHHAPQTMNLSVGYAHFFLEGPYADIIRTTICILLGVNPLMLFLIMFIDGTWGAFIHVGEHLIKDGRLGFLHKLILTPSHHRVHHARNPLYMDTNFCNLLNIWDRIFGTFQPEKADTQPDYGITRKMDSGSFLDSYFGEIVALVKDVAKAPGVINKIRYVIMPPGWSHTGEHKTAKQVRAAYLREKANQPIQGEQLASS